MGWWWRKEGGDQEEGRPGGDGARGGGSQGKGWRPKGVGRGKEGGGEGVGRLGFGGEWCPPPLAGQPTWAKAQAQVAVKKHKTPSFLSYFDDFSIKLSPD